MGKEAEKTGNIWKNGAMGRRSIEKIFSGIEQKRFERKHYKLKTEQDGAYEKDVKIGLDSLMVSIKQELSEKKASRSASRSPSKLHRKISKSSDSKSRFSKSTRSSDSRRKISKSKSHERKHRLSRSSDSSTPVKFREMMGVGNGKITPSDSFVISMNSSSHTITN